MRGNQVGREGQGGGSGFVSNLITKIQNRLFREWTLDLEAIEKKLKENLSIFQIILSLALSQGLIFSLDEHLS